MHYRVIQPSNICNSCATLFCHAPRSGGGGGNVGAGLPFGVGVGFGLLLGEGAGEATGPTGGGFLAFGPASAGSREAAVRQATSAKASASLLGGSLMCACKRSRACK